MLQRPEPTAVMVYAIVDDALSLDFALGVEREVFIRREDAERFIEEVRGDEPKVAEKLRIEERQLEAGGGVRLRYGWAAKNTSQNDKFLRVQSGTVTLTGPNGYSVTDSWGSGRRLWLDVVHPDHRNGTERQDRADFRDAQVDLLRVPPRRQLLAERGP